jgi:hypothetical protein
MAEKLHIIDRKIIITENPLGCTVKLEGRSNCKGEEGEAQKILCEWGIKMLRAQIANKAVVSRKEEVYNDLLEFLMGQATSSLKEEDVASLLEELFLGAKKGD